MREDQVYLASKRTLLASRFHVVGGQPPRGSDNIPVIEIKGSEGRGSQASMKPDLVALGPDGEVLIVECKPNFSPEDEAKLTSILDSLKRIDALSAELRQRGILPESHAGIRVLGCLAHSAVDSNRSRRLASILCSVEPPIGSWSVPDDWPPELISHLRRVGSATVH